jgi:Undecaprenyl-phosphate glucose phosphotransferase
MLRKHAQFFVSLFVLSDLLVLSGSWILSYFLRFYADPIRPPLLGTPSLLIYVELLLPLWLIWGIVSKKVHLYRPRRVEHFYREFLDISKALMTTLLALVAVIYGLRMFEFSRLALLYFLVMGTSGLTLARYLARRTLKILRKKGYNQRFAIIAGTGELGRKVLEKIELYPELGIQVTGFLTRKAGNVGEKIRGVPVIGAYDDLNGILTDYKVDVFFVAVPIQECDSVEGILRKLQGQMLDVKVVPGALEFLSLRGGVDELDGLPIVSLQSSPLYGWNRVSKRIFDVILGTIFLILSFPLMLVIGLLVRLTSPGPIFYKQERLGMNGHSFQMLKFRTMRVDAEKVTGPVWAKENDSRRTKLGAILRKTSLDELPQLFNVLKDDMSIVGPRPERPNFVKEFRNGIPSYMLRHKIKAGMTGWAQVNGWRGNTSIEKRIEHDLYYVQNWSVTLDMKILLMTLWKGFFNKMAY